jgi:hypothetical protein
LRRDHQVYNKSHKSLVIKALLNILIFIYINMFKINKVNQLFFLYSLRASFLLYIIVLLGVGGFAPQYLDQLKSFLRIYIGSLLVIYYNPITYSERKFGEFDRQLVFSSGVFLLLSSTIIGSIESYLQNNAKLIIGNNINNYISGMFA